MGEADSNPEATVVMPSPVQSLSPLDPELLDRLDARLRQFLAEYQTRLADTPDYEDLSQAVYERAIREAAGALDRIQNGTYGSCEQCHGQIAVERLQALPHATTCTGCAGSPERR